MYVSIFNVALLFTLYEVVLSFKRVGKTIMCEHLNEAIEQ